MHDTTKMLTVYFVARRVMVVQHSPHVAMEQCVTRLTGIMMYGHVETLSTLMGANVLGIVTRGARERRPGNSNATDCIESADAGGLMRYVRGIRRCDSVWRKWLSKRSVASANRRHIRGHIV